METGNALSSSSEVAIAIGSLRFLSIVTNGGAPIASCNDLAPTILAFSKRVNFGGPTLISKPPCGAFLGVFFTSLEGVGTKNLPREVPLPPKNLVLIFPERIGAEASPFFRSKTQIRGSDGEVMPVGGG